MSATTPRIRLVVCGLGGQGNIYLAKLLAGAAILEGRRVLTTETHGMAQRGGAVESYIKIGAFSSPIVRRGRADAVMVLDERRLATAQAYLRPGGRGFANLVGGARGAPPGTSACPASEIAHELGCRRGTNLVLLGFAARTRPELFPEWEALQEALERLGPPAAIEENRRALEAGAAAV